MIRLLFAGFALLVLAACTSERETLPPRTAMEQLLISGAVDDALQSLRLEIPDGTRIWVDGGFFEGYDQRYAIGAIRDRLLRAGARMAAERSGADTIVEIRAGALSIDESGTFVGLPGGSLPVPLTGSNIPTPEIPLFRRDRVVGVAKIGLTAYSARTGALEPFSPAGPVYGFSRRTDWESLFVGWSETDVLPEGVNRQ